MAIACSWLPALHVAQTRAKACPAPPHVIGSCPASSQSSIFPAKQPVAAARCRTNLQSLSTTLASDVASPISKPCRWNLFAVASTSMQRYVLARAGRRGQRGRRPRKIAQLRAGGLTRPRPAPQTSNLVLQPEREGRRPANEPTGEAESLWGHMQFKMGDRVDRSKPAELEGKLDKLRKRFVPRARTCATALAATMLTLAADACCGAQARAGRRGAAGQEAAARPACSAGLGCGAG